MTVVLPFVLVSFAIHVLCRAWLWRALDLRPAAAKSEDPQRLSYPFDFVIRGVTDLRPRLRPHGELSPQ